MKGVCPLYQLLLVLGDDDIIITPTKPWKWATQLALIVKPLCKN